MEVDPDIAETARVNLAKNGRNATAVLGDGAEGLPDHAPYDRVIATLSVSVVPYTWVAQTRTGGYIITPWRIPLLNGLLLRLQVSDDGTASGHFVNTAVFMPMRSQRPPNEDVPIDQEATDEHTTVDPREPINDDHAQFAVGLLVPECYEWTEKTAHGFVQRLDDPSSGSWATVTVDQAAGGPYAVRQGGPRQLWDEVVSAYQWWQDAGSPPFTRFGVTVTRAGETVWFDHPGNVIAPTL